MISIEFSLHLTQIIQLTDVR